jgi:hypothetical protein
MKDDTILFKSISFLTTLVKCSRGSYYLNNGFIEEDLKTEVIEALKKDLPLSEAEKKEFIRRVERDYLLALNFLEKESLIYFNNGRYYITEEGNNMTNFMMDLSKMYSVFPHYSNDMPFRNYPNSNSFYGLN